MWTRWRCRRCYHDIPAGLRGKYRQPIAARNREWSTGSSSSSGDEERRNKNLEAEDKGFEPGLRPWKKKEGEGVQGGQGLPLTERKRPGRRVVEDEAESRKKLDDQKKKIQKELRDIEKFSCVPKELQESIKSNLQQQLQEVEQRRHDLMPEHQKVQKRQQKTQSIQDKRRNMQEESAAGQKEMQSVREEIDRKEERFRQLSDKVDKNKMVDAEMAAELQGLQAGEERRGSNASQPGDGCLEALWQQLIAFERMELRPLYRGSNVEWERHKGQMSGREKERSSEDEQEQDKASQQWALSGSSGCIEGHSSE